MYSLNDDDTLNIEKKKKMSMTFSFDLFIQVFCSLAMWGVLPMHGLTLCFRVILVHVSPFAMTFSISSGFAVNRSKMSKQMFFLFSFLLSCEVFLVPFLRKILSFANPCAKIFILSLWQYSTWLPSSEYSNAGLFAQFRLFPDFCHQLIMSQVYQKLYRLQPPPDIPKISVPYKNSLAWHAIINKHLL